MENLQKFAANMQYYNFENTVIERSLDSNYEKIIRVTVTKESGEIGQFLAETLPLFSVIVWNVYQYKPGVFSIVFMEG